MKRMAVFVLSLTLMLGLGGMSLAQDDATALKGAKGFKTFDANGDGKVTKDEFMAASQKRAEARWAKLDPTGKGYVTQEEFSEIKQKAREKFMERKANKASKAAGTPAQ